MPGSKEYRTTNRERLLTLAREYKRLHKEELKEHAKMPEDFIKQLKAA